MEYTFPSWVQRRQPKTKPADEAGNSFGHGSDIASDNAGRRRCTYARWMVPTSSMCGIIVSEGPQRQGTMSDDDQASGSNREASLPPQEQSIVSPPAPNTQPTPATPPRPPAKSKRRAAVAEIFDLPPIPAPLIPSVTHLSPIQQQGTHRSKRSHEDQINASTEEATRHVSEDEGPERKRQKVATKPDGKGGRGAKGAQVAQVAKQAQEKRANGHRNAGKAKVKVEVSEEAEKPPMSKPEGRVLRSQAPKPKIPSSPTNVSTVATDSDSWYVPLHSTSHP